MQALNGFGGVGKTQTALEYAYRYQQDYQVVLWAKAHSRETLVADFASMAGLLNLPEKDAQDQSEAVIAVKRWLENNDGWLLILDNADELAMAREFIPSRETGHVLLTTRAQNTRPIAARQAVEKMSPQEGAFFLLRRLEVIKKDQTLESAPKELREQAEALSKAVDGLPLALGQAAAFIEETPSTLWEYQTFYQKERKELLKRQGKLAEDHPPVTTTFSLAFKKVAEVNQAAADLLRLCAFLDADAIPEEIFHAGAEELGDALSTVANRPLSLTEVIGEAGRFSLLQRNPEARTVSLHRLVQAVLRDEIGDASEQVWAERAVRALADTFPEHDYGNWTLCGRLIQHVQSLAGVINEFSFDFTEAAQLLCRAGFYLEDRAQYAEAEPLFKIALCIYEKTLGAEHLCVATALDGLGMIYKEQGRYAEAEPLCKRVVAIREKILGDEHLSFVEGINNLGLLYSDLGKLEEAEQLLKRTVDIGKKALGLEHPDVSTFLNNLASVYEKLGKYADMEVLVEQALAIDEKVLGPEHPDTTYSLNNLGSVYDKQGKYKIAEVLHHRALAIRERVFGLGHPLFALSLHNLALVYEHQGKCTDAEPLYQRALDIREKTLGPEHPDTLRVLGDYAGLLRKMSREDEADELEVRRRT